MATPGGGLSASIVYDGYGNTVTSLPTRYRYTGREYDSFTGLYYYRARWYDAQIGRFISEDPIGFAGGDVNLYCYVWNNPLTYKDPYGLWAGWDDVVFIGGGAIIGLASQGIGDLLNGQVSSWEDYASAGIGGAVAGGVLLYTGNPVLAGAANGAIGNLSRQGLKYLTGKQCKPDYGGFVLDTGFGALLGSLNRPKIAGINKGRGNFLSIGKGLETKISKGIISGMSPKSAFKWFLGRQIDDGVIESTIGSTALGIIRSGESSGKKDKFACQCQ